jgi:hypothetical protein
MSTYSTLNRFMGKNATLDGLAACATGHLDTKQEFKKSAAVYLKKYPSLQRG